MSIFDRFSQFLPRRHIVHAANNGGTPMRDGKVSKTLKEEKELRDFVSW
jgi:hypothetical protein